MFFLWLEVLLDAEAAQDIGVITNHGLIADGLARLDRARTGITMSDLMGKRILPEQAPQLSSTAIGPCVWNVPDSWPSEDVI